MGALRFTTAKVTGKKALGAQPAVADRMVARPQFCFGKAVRQIVEGETRFSKIGAISESASRAELAALDLKQLFLAMTEEVRIIVVKLADRLHNMRTLGSMPAHKQQKIAKETLLVRGPPAGCVTSASLVNEKLHHPAGRPDAVGVPSTGSRPYLADTPRADACSAEKSTQYQLVTPGRWES